MPCEHYQKTWLLLAQSNKSKTGRLTAKISQSDLVHWPNAEKH